MNAPGTAPSATFTLTFTISDSINQVPITMTVTILPTLPPVITNSALTKVTIIGGEASQSRTFTATDPQGFTITGSSVGTLPSYVTYSNFKFTIAPGLNEPSAIVTIQYKASNPYISSAPQSFDVEVIFNDPPVQTAGISDFSISVGQQITKSILANDPQGRTVTLTMTNTLPSYITIPGTFQFLFKPLLTQGNSTFTGTYSLSDGLKTTSGLTFKVTVVNDQPVVTPIADFSIQAGSSSVTKTIVAVDPEGATVSVTSVSISHTSFITRSGFTFTIAPPLNTAALIATVTYYISDGINTVGSFQFKVTVINNPPTIDQNIGDFTMHVGSGPITKSIQVSDQEGATVTTSLNSNFGFISLSGFQFTFTPLTTQGNGTFTAQYMISDGVQQVGWTTFIVTVVNDQPVVTPIADFSISAGSPSVTKTIVAVDPEGATLSVTSVTISHTFITRSGFTFTIAPPLNTAALTATVSYKIYDGINTVGPFQFLVTVSNNPPTIDQNIADFTMHVGSGPIQKSIQVSDLEGATVSVSLYQAYSFISMNVYQFTFNPLLTQGNSTTTVQYKISDGVNNVGWTSFIVTVVNDQPVVTPIADFSISAGSPSVTKTVIATDPEGGTVQIVSGSVTISHTSFITRSGMVFTINPPINTAATIATVKYSVTDGINTVGLYTLLITIKNDPPTLDQNIADFTVYVGSGPITKSILATDPEGATIILTDLTTGLPSFITRAGLTLSFNPSYSSGNSTTPIQYKLYDGVQYIGPFTFTVKVENRVPVISTPIQDISMAVGTGPITNVIDAIDPDGRTLTLTLTASPPSYVTKNGLVFTINPSMTQSSGSISISFTLTDGVNTLPASSFTITLINQPPVWTAVMVDQQCTVGSICNYDPGFNDPEGGTVTMSFTKPSWVTTTATNGFKIQPSYLVSPGFYDVMNIILSDGFNTIAPVQFKVEVINTPPVSQTLADLTVLVGQTASYSVLPSSDPEGNAIQTNVYYLDSSYSSFDSTALKILFAPPLYQAEEVRTIEVQYFDGALTTSNTFKLKILNAPALFMPNLTEQNLTETFSSTYTLPIPFDPEGNAVSFQFINVLDLPSFATWNDLSKSLSFSPLPADVGKNFSCKFNLSDGAQMSQYLLNITVRAIPKVTGNFANMVNSLSNLGPPYFTSGPSISLKAGTKLSYELPTIADPDNDPIEAPIITLGPISPFSKLGSATKIELAPEVKDVGTYKIKVLLKDKNPLSVSQKEYSITVEVLPIETTQSTTIIVGNSTSSSGSHTNSSSQIKFTPTKVSLQLAKGKINNDGYLTLKFVPSLNNYLLASRMQAGPFLVTLVEPTWNGNSPTTKLVKEALSRDRKTGTQLKYNVTEVTLTQVKLQLDLGVIASLPSASVILYVNNLFSKTTIFLWK
ncbi:hypothetical protein FGO68_gene8252 [Halteria grandinella]|uniref:Cadherin domain-containing protein n=1 Tax=Halteria grandinella TaxID=5974 RepID=A0A8J8TB25_HALGN|nr:hypothetical protein FGO68_gene8252 [Halteria grandinella]